MALKIVWLIFVVGFTFFDLSAGYKCEFVKPIDYSELLPANVSKSLLPVIYYSCKINPESNEIIEQHSLNKNDINVEKIELNGTINGISQLSQLNFPFCERFQDVIFILIRQIKTIDKNSFQDCQNLHKIEIEHTEIEEVPECLFTNQTNLNSLTISDSKLKTLPENIFADQRELEKLNLRKNKINFFQQKIFKSLDKLWNVDLAYNKISDLSLNIFKPLISLKYLNLGYNQLTTIHSDSFGPLNKVSINIEMNQINSIDEDLIERGSENEIYIRGNPCSNAEGWIPQYKMEKYFERCFEHYQPRGSENLVADIIAPITNVTVQVGQKAVLTCEVQGLDVHRSAWLRVDAKLILAVHKYVITRNDRVEVRYKRRRLYQLIVNNVQESDKGWYECQINTDPIKGQKGYLDVIA